MFINRSLNDMFVSCIVSNLAVFYLKAKFGMYDFVILGEPGIGVRNPKTNADWYGPLFRDDAVYS